MLTPAPRWVLTLGVIAAACSEPAPPAQSKSQARLVSERPAHYAADDEPECVVLVDAQPDIGNPPLTVRFETELDCSSSPVTYSWDFGDGASAGNVANPKHTYEMTGDFVAVVRVRGADGAESDDEIDIVVDPMLGQ